MSRTWTGRFGILGSALKRPFLSNLRVGHDYAAQVLRPRRIQSRFIYSNQNKPESKKNLANDLDKEKHGAAKKEVDQARNVGQSTLKGETVGPSQGDSLRTRSATGGGSVSSPTVGPDFPKEEEHGRKSDSNNDRGNDRGNDRDNDTDNQTIQSPQTEGAPLRGQKERSNPESTKQQLKEQRKL